MALSFPNWVADDAVENRQKTATLLVGTAKEYGLTVRHHISSTRGGFFISDDLADAIDSDSDTPEPEPTKKTSGNRAAKNTGTAKEQDSA